MVIELSDSDPIVKYINNIGAIPPADRENFFENTPCMAKIRAQGWGLTLQSCLPMPCTMR